MKPANQVSALQNDLITGPPSSLWQRHFGSLRAQLIFWNVIALSLLLGGLGIVCRYITYSYMMQSVRQELEHSASMFMRPPPAPPPPREEHGRGERGGPDAPFGQFPPDQNPGGNGSGGPNGRGRHRPPDAENPYRAHLFTADGKSAMPDDTRAAWDTKALQRALQGEKIFTFVVAEDEPLLILSSPAFDRQRRKSIVQAAYPLREVNLAVSGIDTALLLLIPIGLLGAGSLGAALTRRVLRRVQIMTHSAGRIGAEDFSRRLPVSGHDEFAELADTFNGLLGRLDHAYQEQRAMLELQRRFTADASHELKTPLTIVKGSTGLALSRETTDEKSRRTFQEIDAAANTMSQLVQDLLLLARSDSGQMGSNRIEMLIREVLECSVSQSQQGIKADSAPICLNIDPEELAVIGNEAELVRLFRNLLDNALQYTPAEGCITVTAKNVSDSVVVSVQDTGAGIASEHLPHLGERFYRVDSSRARHDGGTGLGLSICKGIVDAHDGSMTVESAVGKGTKVTITLPCS